MMADGKEPTPAEIAAYLLERINAEGTVYQSDFVHDVSARFGEKFVFINDNGNPAVVPSVYRVFRKIKAENPREVQWDRWDFSWNLGKQKSVDSTT